MGPVGDFLDHIKIKTLHIMATSTHEEVGSRFLSLFGPPYRTGIYTYRTHWASCFFLGGVEFSAPFYGRQVFQHIFWAPFGYKRYPLKTLP